jgi:hypothetical protein
LIHSLYSLFHLIFVDLFSQRLNWTTKYGGIFVNIYLSYTAYCKLLLNQRLFILFLKLSILFLSLTLLFFHYHNGSVQICNKTLWSNLSVRVLSHGMSTHTYAYNPHNAPTFSQIPILAYFTLLYTLDEPRCVHIQFAKNSYGSLSLIVIKHSVGRHIYSTRWCYEAVLSNTLGSYHYCV